MSKRMVAALLVTVLSAPAWAQGRLGAEFQVNTYTAGVQSSPAVALMPGGGFVVAWSSFGQDGSDRGVFARLFDGSGSPLGADFQVNSHTTGRQAYPSLVVDAVGNFVVVWSSPQDGDGFGLVGQRFNASGSRLGGEFQVNTYTTGLQTSAELARDALNGFIAVWGSGGADASLSGIFARRFNAGGAALGAEFTVNSHTFGVQQRPTVASNGTGEFVVLWEGSGSGDTSGVFGRQFDPGGTPAGLDFRLNTYTTDDQFVPSVAVNQSGDFVGVWSSSQQAGSARAVVARQYSAAGSPTTAELVVNNFAPAAQFAPKVAMDGAGNFVVVWFNAGEDGSSQAVVGRIFQHPGPVSGPTFVVNTYTAGAQDNPAVAMDAAGNFVVVWVSSGQDGNGTGVFGQRFLRDLIFGDGFE